MAGKYDDLLESFMNNSAKVFDEDKKMQKEQPNKKPAAYIESDNTSKQHVKRTRTKSTSVKKSSPKKPGHKKKRRACFFASKNTSWLCACSCGSIYSLLFRNSHLWLQLCSRGSCVQSYRGKIFPESDFVYLRL